MTTETCNPRWQQIWEERAARFARVPETEETGQQLPLVIARLGAEYYGIEAPYIFRIRPANQTVYVPRAPAWIVGLAHERGHILAILDLPRFWQIPQAPPVGASPTLILVETPEMELALLTDEVLAVTALPLDRIQAPGETLRGLPPAHVRGIVEHWQVETAPDEEKGHSIIVLDLPALLADERIRIRETLTR